MKRAVLWLVAFAFALAGCVGPGPDDITDHHGADGHHHDQVGGQGEANLPVTGAEDVLIDVTAGTPSEFRFTPERIAVETGQRVGIVFTNKGGAEHELSIDALGFHIHAASDETESAAFVAPAPGEYVIGCYIPGHFEAGMQATLAVR